MAYRLRAVSPFPGPDDTIRADKYLDKCVEKLPDLLVEAPSLRLVQACITIGMLLETSERCERAPFFVSMAIRFAHELGYNDLPNDSTAVTVEQLEKRYVFWQAFFMDAHMSFARQRTCSIRLDDISTPIPSASTCNWWEPSDEGPGHGQWNLNVFALHCGLAVIEAAAAEQLFTASARRQSLDRTRRSYDAAIAQLHDWRISNPLANLDASDVLKSMYRSDIVLSIILEASYFRTLYQLHATWSLTNFGEKVDIFSPESLGSMMRMGRASYHADAVRLLRLMVLTPQGDVSTTW